jgi:hypothetical protein
MLRRALAAPPATGRLAPDPSLALRLPTDRAGVLTTTDLGSAMSMDWSLERLLDRLEGRR